MARQSGVIRLRGQIGGMSFYKTSKDGFLAREKGGVDAQRIKTDPNFARTRENGAEFGRAGSAGKLLRTSLRSLTMNAQDSRMSSRLTKAMMQVIQADTTNTRGQRNVIDGETELLQGFEFNIDAVLNKTLFAPYTLSIDRATGKGTVNIPAFVPEQFIAAPQGTTHFKLVSGVAAIDFENGTYVTDKKETAEFVINNVATAVATLENTFTVASTHPVFLAFGIEFLQQVNGAFYPLKNGAYNALSIVKVDGGV